MNILIVNPIVYTSETKNIIRANSIKDTMIYDLCLAFEKKGHNVTLYAAEPFKPENKEKYPFKVIWGKCKFKSIFMPHCFPYMYNLSKYIKKNESNIDLIICSEVFSINTLNAVLTNKSKVIVWHELAKHNAMMKKLPSKIWYNIVARFLMRNVKVVARSEEAKSFIKKYCRDTDSKIIEHGVNLDKFIYSTDKKDYFVVCSQLIERKRIDGILLKFGEYLKISGNSSELIIIGDGELKSSLEQLSRGLGLEEKIIFKGKLNHEELLPYLAHAKALLVNTIKDNSMISIVESIAVGTPVVTTEIPLNASYIKKYKLGIATEWDQQDLMKIVNDNEVYVNNCLKYREKLSTVSKVDDFMNCFRKMKES